MALIAWLMTVFKPEVRDASAPLLAEAMELLLQNRSICLPPGVNRIVIEAVPDMERRDLLALVSSIFALRILDQCVFLLKFADLPFSCLGVANLQCPR